MPGMMDTILNLGLNEDVVEVIAKKDVYKRQLFGVTTRFWNCFCFIKLFNYLYLLPPFWLFFGS